jgi:hypothetical protein
MTRAERLVRTEEQARSKLEAQRKRLAHVQAQRVQQERKLRDKHRYRVGALADEVGLLALSDADLAGLFALLAPLTQVPNPVAVLEALLAAPGCLDTVSVDGTATPCGSVSALRAELAGTRDTTKVCDFS